MTIRAFVRLRGILLGHRVGGHASKHSASALRVWWWKACAGWSDNRDAWGGRVHSGSGLVEPGLSDGGHGPRLREDGKLPSHHL